MNWLVTKVGIIQRREERDEYDLRRARVSTTRAAYDHKRHLYDAGMVSSHVWDIISNTIDPYTKELTDSMQDVLNAVDADGGEVTRSSDDGERRRVYGQHIITRRGFGRGTIVGAADARERQQC
jgi:hypothetical protein